MTTWTLLFFFLLDRQPFSSRVDGFKSAAACMEAARKAESGLQGASAFQQTPHVRFVCVEIK